MDSWIEYLNNNGLDPTKDDVTNEYFLWLNAYVNGHPEFTYDYWENQKETIDQWQSIR